MKEIRNIRIPKKEELEYIRKYLRYDSKAGKIVRLDRSNADGSYDKDGYLILKINSRQYRSHRIAWFLHYNDYPTMEIDHINRVRDDNRIKNLRQSNRIENARNSISLPNKDTGVVGVYLDKTKGLLKNKATKINDTTYRFYTVEEAKEWRIKNGLKV